MLSDTFFMWIAIVVIPHLCSSYTKTCDGFQECDGETIDCPLGEDCEIQCTGNSACHQSIVNCPTDHECLINCDDWAACYDMAVHAKDASKLEYTGCTKDYSCNDMTIYCPPNVNGVKKCIMAGDASFGAEDYPYMQFYAIYGWNDIDFSGYSSGLWSSRKGTMHCTEDYSQSCSIDSGFDSYGKWTCDDRNHICMDPPTPSPSTPPSISPSNFPTTTPTITTVSPSVPPTNVPSMSPSDVPTSSPTYLPTRAPTNFPSNNPTKVPTISPSMNPTGVPTDSPTMKPTLSPSSSPTSPNLKINIAVDDQNKNNVDLSDSLEVNNEETTSSKPPNDAVNATVSDVHNSSFVEQYIKWIVGIAAVFIALIVGFCLYLRKRRKNKPKVYHTEHAGDEKDIEMQGNVVIDEDGMETIMPPKRGKIKYSPLGAVNLNLATTNSNNLSIYRESVASQSHPSHHVPKSSTFDVTMPNIAPIAISMDASSIIPSSASIHTMNAFVLDAGNDHEIFGNDINSVITPRLDEEDEDGIDGMNFDDITIPNANKRETPSGNVEDDMDKDFDIDAIDVDDVVLDKNINVDDEMVNDLNNDVMIVNDGIMTTKGSDEFVVGEITDNGAAIE